MASRPAEAKSNTILPHGEFVTFSALTKLIPEPFRAEITGGLGQTIHDKFVVIDFDTDKPVVFFGSSNLAAGGESENGDNLLAVFDQAIAVAFAVEAVKLFDHYEFRSAVNRSTEARPLALRPESAQPPWYAPYYDNSSIRYKDRELFAGIRE